MCSGARFTLSLSVEHAYLVIATLGERLHVEVAGLYHIAVVLAISSVTRSTSASVLPRGSVLAHSTPVARALFDTARADSEALATGSLLITRLALASVVARFADLTSARSRVTATIVRLAQVHGSALFAVATETGLAAARALARGTGTALRVLGAVAIVNLANVLNFTEKLSDVARRNFGLFAIQLRLGFVGYIARSALAVTFPRRTVEDTDSKLLATTIVHLAWVVGFAFFAVTNVLHLAIEREGVGSSVTFAHSKSGSRFGANATFNSAAAISIQALVDLSTVQAIT